MERLEAKQKAAAAILKLSNADRSGVAGEDLEANNMALRKKIVAC